MKKFSHYAVMGCLGLSVTAVYAQDASINIIAPTDGTVLKASEKNIIQYDVVPGPKGDHTHLYVDGKELAVLRELKGSHALGDLSPGAHDVCIKVVNKGHTPIGVDKCVKVSVE